MNIKPKNILLLFSIIGIAFLVGFLFITTITYQNVNAQSQCHPTLWKYVWSPQRLIKIGDPHYGDCKTVTGYIHQIKKERDGDAHILIDVDPKYKNLLTNGNYVGKGGIKTKGYLVAEIVCHYKPQFKTAALACKSKPNTYDPNMHKLTIPPINSHVSITGYLVHDKNHPGQGHQDWAEIHPVSSIKKIK